MSFAPTVLDLDVHEIPTKFTKGFSTVRSVGNEIIWSASGVLWRYAPGDDEPERIFAAEPGVSIVDIAGSTAGYAFVTRAIISDYDPPTRWHLWYLEAPLAEPRLLDKFDNDRMPPPTLAMDDRHIAWTPFHRTGDAAVNELRVVSIDDLDHPSTLVSYPALDANIWFPVFDGDWLWYGIRFNDWVAETTHPRVELLDLGRPGVPPQIYGEDLHAFMPAVNDQVVVWKGGGAESDAALSPFNSGQLYVYWRENGSIETIPVPGWSSDRVSYPSVGDRFVAWWDDNATQFYIYDLEGRAVRKIVEYEPTGEQRITRVSLAGNLIAFVYSHGDEFPLQIRWAYLPV